MTRTTTRVLMTTNTVGSVWTYACKLVEALAGHGVQVTLAAMGDPPARDRAVRV